MNKVREHLRDATREMHERVDILFSGDGMASPAGYARMLLVHAAIVPPVEELLRAGPHLSELPDLASRFRTADLASDLDALGHALPKPAGMSFLNSRGGSAGLMYVLEGSRLGAQVICRRLATELGTGFPSRFLRHGAGGGLWPSFLAWLEGTDWDDTEMQDMRQNAVGLFAAYIETEKAVRNMHEFAE